MRRGGARRAERHPARRGAALPWRLVGIAAMPLLLLPGCSHKRDRAAIALPATNWRAIATEADRTRIRTWRDAWVQGLALVTAPADRARVAAEGALLQPDAAQLQPAPPSGDYRCRLLRIGVRRPGPAYVTAPAGACRIAREGDVLSLARLDGPQRPTGLLLPDDGGRLVFLGTMILGDEKRALDYGRDPERDVAGVFERIGPDRWRLVLPFPRWEATIDVIELIPAAG